MGALLEMKDSVDNSSLTLNCMISWSRMKFPQYVFTDHELHDREYLKNLDISSRRLLNKWVALWELVFASAF